MLLIPMTVKLFSNGKKLSKVIGLYDTFEKHKETRWLNCIADIDEAFDAEEEQVEGEQKTPVIKV